MSEREATQVCTFMIDGMWFGVDVTRVQEVLRYQEMTPVPLAPGVVAGLINLRGQIVTALDMRTQLDLPERDSTALPMNVVVRHDEEVVSLLVDEIGDVVDVDEQSLEPPPETLAAHTKTLISGVYKLEQQLLLLLNTQLAVRVDASSNSKRSPHVQH